MRVDYVFGGDWSAVYLDGHLYHQGHSIPRFIWTDLLSKTRDYDTDTRVVVTDSEIDFSYLDEHGSYPENFREILQHLESFTVVS